jgi:hypothetical protein
MVIKRRVGEGGDGFGNIMTRCFDGNVVVVGEVDTGMGLGRIVGDAKQFSL